MAEVGEGTKQQKATVIEKSGCPHIQEAVAVAKKHGIPLTDLPDQVLNTLERTIASAQSQGAQAGVKRKE
jgi:hypothetical protein